MNRSLVSNHWLARPPANAAKLPAGLAVYPPRLKRIPFLPTTTDRDWSAFDAPAVERMTARVVRTIQSNRSFAQAG